MLNISNKTGGFYMKKIFQIFLFLILSSTIFSQTPNYNEEFKIIDYYYVPNLNLTSLVNGNFVASWDLPGEGGYFIDSDIYAQMFDSNAVKIENEILVNSTVLDIQKQNYLASLKNGGFVITWKCWLQTGGGYGVGYYAIYMQIFDEDGEKSGDEVLVKSPEGNVLDSPGVCGLSNGGFIIYWNRLTYNPNDTDIDIIAQLFDENAVKVGEEFQVNSFGIGYQENERAIELDSERFIFCWESRPDDEDDKDIFAQIFSNDGIKIGDEFRVNTTTESDQLNSDISLLRNGNFVICWENRLIQDNYIYAINAQLFDTNGGAIGSEFKVNADTLFNKTRPRVSAFGNNEFMVCWNSYEQDGNLHGIFAQLYDHERKQKGSEFRVNSYTIDEQINPILCLLTKERLLVSWRSNSTNIFNKGVFSKYYNPKPIDHNLVLYNLLVPQTSSTINHNNPRFIWQQASEVHINFPWELTYDLYIDKNINFINPTIYEGVQDTTILPDTLINGQTYYWKVLARTYFGDSLWCSDVYNFQVDTNAVTGIKDTDEHLSVDFILHQNYPNPFNPTTKIKFNVPPNVGNENFRSLLKVYDILGNEITTLVNEQKSPGAYEVEFSAEDFSLTSGIYFYKLTVGQFSDTRKMLLIK
jgi:hypothetical protein